MSTSFRLQKTTYLRSLVTEKILIKPLFQEINGDRGVRLRTGRSGQISHSNYEIEDGGSKLRRKSLAQTRTLHRRTIPQYYLAVVYLIYAGLFSLQIYLERYHHPKPLMIEDAQKHPHEFIAERAMTRLIKLTNIGPRVAGSYENEVLAADLLKREITKIIQNANPIHTIEMDVQKYSGSFPLRFLDGLTNVYRNVQDIVVRVASHDSSSHSLLINCHFDSFPDSPGGSDDGAGCTVMLEILDVLSKSNEHLNNNIIFLFNGAEENLMHGSHGFITQHRWAKEVRAFINLEACGAGGREVLFQSGPNSPWIMEVIKKKFFFSLSIAISCSGSIFFIKLKNLIRMPLLKRKFPIFPIIFPEVCVGHAKAIPILGLQFSTSGQNCF